MKGLSSLERVVLECLGKQTMSHNQIVGQSGLQENVCFNILQALVIRGFISTNGINYRISENLSPLILDEINGHDAKVAESMEMIEAIVEQKQNTMFRFQKVAMDERDYKIFLAMLSNLESFLADSHKKFAKETLFKDRKVVFWGVSDIKSTMHQLVNGGRS